MNDVEVSVSDVVCMRMWGMWECSLRRPCFDSFDCFDCFDYSSCRDSSRGGGGGGERRL